MKKTLIIMVAVVVVVVSITVAAGNLFSQGDDSASPVGDDSTSSVDIDSTSSVDIDSVAPVDDSTSSVGSNVTPKENAAKSGEAMRTYETGMEPFIIEGGKLIYTKNLDASVDACLASGDYKTREYVERKLLADWLFNREAEANGITVSEEEVDELILDQKRVEQECKEENIDTGFDAYLESLGMTEDEYYDAFRNEYRELILTGKYSDYLYKQYSMEKEEEYLKAKYTSRSKEDFQRFYEEEFKTGPYALTPYRDYIKAYKENLRNKILAEKTVVRETHEIE